MNKQEKLGLEERKQRGLEIAATTKLKHRKEIWWVRSQSKSLIYEVNFKSQTCTCPYFETESKKCKHIFAVEFTIDREFDFDPEKTKRSRISYPQNWSAYNAAQTHEKERAAELLKALCDGIVQPSQIKKRGRPFLPLKEIVFSATMKIYGTHSGRRSACDLRDFKAKNLLTNAPHYNTIFRYLGDKNLTPILKSLIEESALPLKAFETSFAADCSGFSTNKYSRWIDEKYGKHGKKVGEKDWFKAHIMTGVKTNIITSVEFTKGRHKHDTEHFTDLLDSTANRFTMKEFMADKAYLSRNIFEAVVAKGATPYIPFKSNTTGEGSELWQKLFHYFQYKREEFLAHYHKRSNAETTFSMIKAKFGQNIRSKSLTAQVNELLCKMLCHNLAVLVSAIYELGIEPEFWKKAA